MHFRLSMRWTAAVWVGLGLATACPGHARAQTNKPAPPAKPAVTVPAPKPEDRLNKLEDELRRLFHSLSPRDTLQDAGPTLPPVYPVPIVPTSRQKDHSRDWMFVDPNDPAASVAEQWLNKDKPNDSGPDSFFGAKPQKKNDLERFYDQLYLQRNVLNPDDPAQPKPDALSALPGNQPDQTRNQSQEQDKNADDKLPSELRGPANTLQKMLSASPLEKTRDPWPPSTLSDLFSSPTPNSTLSPADLKAHQAYMDEYRKIFDAPAPQPSSTTPITAVNPANPALSTLPDYGGLNSLNPSRASSSPALAGTLPNPASALDDQSATVLNRWNPLYTPPKPEPAPTLPLFSAPFEVPRRRF
jgi:hypothetical protein